MPTNIDPRLRDAITQGLDDRKRRQMYEKIHNWAQVETFGIVRRETAAGRDYYAIPFAEMVQYAVNAEYAIDSDKRAAFDYLMTELRNIDGLKVEERCAYGSPVIYISWEVPS